MGDAAGGDATTGADAWSPAGSPGGWCHFHPGRLAAGRCAACDARICADCGSPLTQPGAPPGAGVCPTCAPQYGVPSSVPFEDPALGAWTGFWRTFGWVFGRPTALWRSFPHGPIGRAVLFAYLANLPVALVSTCVQFLGVWVQRRMSGLPGAGPDPFQEVAEFLGVTVDTLYALQAALPILSLVLLPALLFFLTVFHHIPVLIFGGQAGFATTFRLVCYLSPLRLLDILCWPARDAWHAVLMVGALRRTHRLGTGAAVVAAVTPLAITLALCCGGMGLAIMIAMSAAGGFRPPIPSGG